MTREECMAEQNHLEWLRHPDWWANWPVQTLKRRKSGGEFPQCGVVLCDGEHTVPLVYECMLMLVSPQTLEAATKFEYESIEALLADGWIVD